MDPIAEIMDLLQSTFDSDLIIRARNAALWRPVEKMERRAALALAAGDLSGHAEFIVKARELKGIAIHGMTRLKPATESLAEDERDEQDTGNATTDGKI